MQVAFAPVADVLEKANGSNEVARTLHSAEIWLHTLLQLLPPNASAPSFTDHATKNTLAGADDEGELLDNVEARKRVLETIEHGPRVLHVGGWTWTTNSGDPFWMHYRKLLTYLFSAGTPLPARLSRARCVRSRERANCYCLKQIPNKVNNEFGRRRALACQRCWR